MKERLKEIGGKVPMRLSKTTNMEKELPQSVG